MSPFFLSKYSPEAMSVSYFLVADILKYKRTTATRAARLSESDWKGNWCLEKKIGHTINALAECQPSRQIYKYVYDAISTCTVFISTEPWIHYTPHLKLGTFARKKRVIPQGSRITLCIIAGLKIWGKLGKTWIETTVLSPEPMSSFIYIYRKTNIWSSCLRLQMFFVGVFCREHFYEASVIIF